VYGARTSLLVAVSVAVLAGVIALLVGALAGFVGGALDELLMRAAEFTWVMPRFFLAIATAALFGGRIAALVVLLGLVSWPGPARVLRAAVLGQVRLPYVEAARASGASPIRILARHVVPNSLGPFIVSTTLLAGSAILIEAALSFLGLSDAASPSWGTMLRDAQPIMARAPWAVVFPALAVTLAVLSFNLIGDALVDALSPWSRRAPAQAGGD
jgi:peptide/nickel transport system permease protein